MILSPEAKIKKAIYMKKYNSTPERKAKVAANGKIWDASHREKRAVYRSTHRNEMKNYCVAHRSESHVRNKIFYISHREQYNTNRLLKKYGLSKSAFLVLLDNQGGVCAICQKCDWGWHGPKIDHDHNAGGLVRGILCQNCNLALGHIHDDPTIARSMSDYLEKFKRGEEGNVTTTGTS